MGQMLEIVGNKIVEVRSMTKKELEHEGWDDRCGTVLVLDNGTKLYASQDDEGNGPGSIFGKSKDGTSFYVGG